MSLKPRATKIKNNKTSFERVGKCAAFEESGRPFSIHARRACEVACRAFLLGFGRFDRFRENYLNPQAGTLAPKQVGRPLDFVLKVGENMLSAWVRAVGSHCSLLGMRTRASKNAPKSLLLLFILSYSLSILFSSVHIHW